MTGGFVQWSKPTFRRITAAHWLGVLYLAGVFALVLTHQWLALATWMGGFVLGILGMAFIITRSQSGRGGE